MTPKRWEMLLTLWGQACSRHENARIIAEETGDRRLLRKSDRRAERLRAVIEAVQEETGFL
jgi:hypothetical protein